MKVLPKRKRFTHLLLDLQKILLHAESIPDAAGHLCERFMAEKEIKGIRVWQQSFREDQLPVRSLLLETGSVWNGAPVTNTEKKWHPVLPTTDEVLPQWVEQKPEDAGTVQTWILPIESPRSESRWILDFTIVTEPKKSEDFIAALECFASDIEFQFEKFTLLNRTRQREEILSLFFAVAPALIVTLSHDERITLFEGNAVQDQKTIHEEIIGEKASRARRQHPELAPILNNLIFRQEETIDIPLGDRIVRTWFYRRKSTVLNEFDMVALGLDVTDQHHIATRNRELAGHLQRLTHELLADESRDRRKLAQQVHDQIGHQLAMILVKMDLVCADASGPVKEAVQALRPPVQEALDESRSLSNEISPPILYKLGLLPAIEWFAEQTSDKVGIPIEVSGDIEQNVDDENKALCYQIITELVINAVKHAGAKRIEIQVSCVQSTLTFSVSDDGKGMPAFAEGNLPAASESSGFGLFSIEQRLAYLEGTMVLKSEPNKGACFEITLPVNSPSENRNESR